MALSPDSPRFSVSSDDARALAAAQLRQQAAVLVVRMRRRVHRARRRLQLEQLLPGAGRAADPAAAVPGRHASTGDNAAAAASTTSGARALKPQRHHRGGLYFPRVPRIDLLTVGEAFQDLIFVGLPHMPRSGEELRTAAVRVDDRRRRAHHRRRPRRASGLRTAVVSALSARRRATCDATGVRVLNLKRPSEAHAVTVSLSTTRDRSFVTFDGVNDRLEPRLPAAHRTPARAGTSTSPLRRATAHAGRASSNGCARAA